MVVNLEEKDEKYEWKILWSMMIVFTYLHIGGAYGLLLALNGSTKFYTILLGIMFYVLSILGTTAGAHRLWSHKSYKATWQLRLFLALAQATAFQRHSYRWALDHRVHHKFTDTDADPHNSKRGFFFSHIGWLLIQRHPKVKNKIKTIDMTDLEADKILMWQKKYYTLVLMPIFCFIIPIVVPVYFWKEDPWTAWYIVVFRILCTNHAIFLINSAAHHWGNKPYDETISATENSTVGIVACGEGWHNYHHAFPWDFKAAELGKYDVNLSGAFIALMAKIGWAYDLRTASLEVIQTRAEKKGDGTLKDSSDPSHHMNSVWRTDHKVKTLVLTKN